MAQQRRPVTEAEALKAVATIRHRREGTASKAAGDDAQVVLHHFVRQRADDVVEKRKQLKRLKRLRKSGA
jgi:hypothetical protein